MDRDKLIVERGVAQGAHASPIMTGMAKQGLIDFLRKQIVDAEWEIARAKASIEAYEAAIVAIERRAMETNG